MKNLIATVTQFAVLPPGTVAAGAGQFDMLVVAVPVFVKDTLLELDIGADGKAVEVFRKPGFAGTQAARSAR